MRFPTYDRGALRRKLEEPGATAEMNTPQAERRVAFALVVPPGEEETERDRLCPDCLALPAPPEERGE